ncbi:Calx-beta domain-containing protein [Nevskia ramosa]|uniref:Calx-beta domain-containing protein n=1 Tax=Nevskia ramosa TaxID=64002 RepID=UPI003D0A3547
MHFERRHPEATFAPKIRRLPTLLPHLLLASLLTSAAVPAVAAAVPTLSVQDATMVEGNAGTSALRFTVTLSPAATTSVSVRASTSNGTALSGSDFIGGSRTITFAPGETSKLVNVALIGDTVIEPDESFIATLSSPTGAAVIGRGTATGTIVNDDGGPPDTTPDPFQFAPVVDAPPKSTQDSQAITVSGVNAAPAIAVANGSYSIDGGAFVSAPGKVAAGQKVKVRQTASATPGGRSSAVLSIGDVSAAFDVTTAEVSTVSIADASINEGNAGIAVLPFTVSLSPASTGTVSVRASTSNGSAVSGSDYSGGALTVTFAPGETSKTIKVAINGDTVAEPDETFHATLVSVSGNAVIVRGDAIGTIINDDGEAASDATPDPFSFPSVSDAEPGAPVNSSAVTITGISAPAPISVSGGLFSINGAAYTSTPASVRAGDQVAVQVSASSVAGETRSALLSVSSVRSTFAVTTRSAVVGNLRPFQFASRNTVERGSAQRSDAVQIRGLGGPATISIEGGRYSINGAPLSSTVGRVAPNDIIEVEVQASSAFDTRTTATLVVAGYRAPFTVETLVVDTTPDLFGFAAAVGQPLRTSVSSKEIIVSGINAPAPISINRGSYRIDGGALTSAAGRVSNGQRVTVVASSAETPATLASAILSIGGVSANFDVVTTGGDSKPDSFGFAAVDGYPNLAAISEPVIISGIDVATPVSVSGGSYSINDRPFSDIPGVIQRGDRLRAMVTAAAMLNDVASATVTVGGLVVPFAVRAAAPRDTIPDLISVQEVLAAPVNSEVISAPITIRGINVPVSIGVSASFSYSINGGAFSTALGTVRSGDVVRMRLASGLAAGRSATGSLAVSNLTTTWSVRAEAAPSRPERFVLTPASSYPGSYVLPGSVQTMLPVSIINPEGAVPVSVTGGQYRINNGPYTAEPGTVVNGDQVTVRFVAPDAYSTASSVSLKVAGVSASLTVTTTVDAVAATPATLSGASGHVYRDDPTVPLRLFVFNPSGWRASDRRSAYIDFSGGGWAIGGLPSTGVRRWASDYGMVAISADYRVNNRFGTYAYVAADDARRIVKWVQDNAASLGIDPERVVVGGNSAGGGNALWTSLSDPPATVSSTSTPPYRPGAIILRSGVSSTEPDAALARSQQVRFGEFLEPISPEPAIDPAIPPYLIMHADGDLTFAQTANLRICSLIRRRGSVCEFINEAGLGHDWSSNAGAAEAAFQQQADFLGKVGMLPAVR